MAKDEALKHSGKGISIESEDLRRLDHRARTVLGLFGKKDHLNVHDMEHVLGLSSRMIRLLAKEWVNEEWLVIIDSSNRSRAYGLSAIYRQ